MNDTLFYILNSRYMGKRPTVITTNFQDVTREEALAADPLRRGSSWSSGSDSDCARGSWRCAWSCASRGAITARPASSRTRSLCVGLDGAGGRPARSLRPRPLLRGEVHVLPLRDRSPASGRGAAGPLSPRRPPGDGGGAGGRGRHALLRGRHAEPDDPGPTRPDRGARAAALPPRAGGRDDRRGEPPRPRRRRLSGPSRLRRDAPQPRGAEPRRRGAAGDGPASHRPRLRSGPGRRPGGGLRERLGRPRPGVAGRDAGEVGAGTRGGARARARPREPLRPRGRGEDPPRPPPGPRASRPSRRRPRGRSLSRVGGPPRAE